MLPVGQPAIGADGTSSSSRCVHGPVGVGAVATASPPVESP